MSHGGAALASGTEGSSEARREGAWPAAGGGATRGAAPARGTEGSSEAAAAAQESSKRGRGRAPAGGRRERRGRRKE